MLSICFISDEVRGSTKGDRLASAPIHALPSLNVLLENAKSIGQDTRQACRVELGLQTSNPGGTGDILPAESVKLWKLLVNLTVPDVTRARESLSEVKIAFNALISL